VHASVTHAFLAQKLHGNCTETARKPHGNVHGNRAETCTETANVHITCTQPAHQVHTNRNTNFPSIRVPMKELHTRIAPLPLTELLNLRSK
jgi:hypothetical protein